MSDIVVCYNCACLSRTDLWTDLWNWRALGIVTITLVLGGTL